MSSFVPPVEKKRPVTALQRQRENEEKKKKKLAKLKEKKKKEKEKGKIKKIDFCLLVLLDYIMDTFSTVPNGIVDFLVQLSYGRLFISII